MRLQEDPASWITLDRVDSTNSYLLNSSHPPGTVVRARHQTAGRGRRGHNWMDREGESVLVSALLEVRTPEFPPNVIRLIPLLTGISALVAARTVYGELLPEKEREEAEFRIKWPNDLMLVRKGVAGKLGGVLVESRLQGEEVMRIVLGVGVNWRSVPELDHSRQFPPVSLLAGERDEDPSLYLPHLVREINARLPFLGDRVRLLDEIRSCFFLTGKRIRLEGISYLVEGLGEDGTLRLFSPESGEAKELFETHQDMVVE